MIGLIIKQEGATENQAHIFLVRAVEDVKFKANEHIKQNPALIALRTGDKWRQFMVGARTVGTAQRFMGTGERTTITRQFLGSATSRASASSRISVYHSHSTPNR
jgi:hypothetical protein